jgi:hypothetical protein
MRTDSFDAVQKSVASLIYVRFILISSRGGLRSEDEENDGGIGGRQSVC